MWVGPASMASLISAPSAGCVGGQRFARPTCPSAVGEGAVKFTAGGWCGRSTRSNRARKAGITVMITNGKIVNAWLYVSITGLTASGNVLGKVSETDAHCSRNPSHEGGPGFQSIPGQRDKEIEFARL